MRPNYRKLALYPIALIWGMCVVITYAAAITCLTGLIKKEPVSFSDLEIPIAAAILAVALFFVIRKLTEKPNRTTEAQKN